MASHVSNPTSTPAKSSRAKRYAAAATTGSRRAVITGAVAWVIGAVAYVGYLPWIVRLLLLAAMVTGIVYCLRNAAARKRGGVITLLTTLGGIGILLPIRATHDRTWAPNNSRLASVQIDDDNIVVQNFRHSIYRSETDFDVHYGTRHFRYSELKAVWFIVQRFTILEGVAHTFVSFEFNSPHDPQFLAISVEVRREEGEAYSVFRGLYRNYELNYVVADERDLIGLRTVYRPNDRVYMYRVNATVGDVQKLFRSFAASIQEIREYPEFYNTATNNCTNRIVQHTYDVTPKPINWLDPRIVLPGFSDRFAYSHKLIGAHDNGESFAQLRARSRIDQRAKDVGITESFSQDIRNGMSP